MYKKPTSNEAGFAHIVIVIILAALIAVVGFLAWRNYSQHRSSNKTANVAPSPSTAATSKSDITWAYENDAWKASGTAPKCPSPLLQTPTDLSTATAILYPGQTRGIYKAHGGVIYRNNRDNNIDVKLAIDSKLVRVARYMQTGQVQYMLDFVSPCGVAVRYDHLHTLTKPFMDIMNKLPEPKVNDSTTTDVQGANYPVGTLIATRIGFLAPDQNTTLDFGVYDYRQPNEASKNPAYAAAHQIGKATDYYATCWLYDLSATAKAAALALPGGDGKAGKTSDYCTQ